MTWYVWICNQCGSTMTLNFDANEADYLRIKNCGCKANGQYEWNHNHNDSGKVI